MFVVLWEFEVKPGSEERFQSAYGPQGAWVRLFQRDPHFRGSQLQRDPDRSLYFFTLDIWDSETAYCQFLEANQAAYQELDRRCEELTLQERRIFSFTLEWPGSSST